MKIKSVLRFIDRMRDYKVYRVSTRTGLEPYYPELDDLYLDSLASIAVVILCVIFCAFLTGLVYGLAQPWVNEILANWEFKP